MSSEFDGLLEYLNSFNNKKLFKRPEENKNKKKEEPKKQTAHSSIKIEDYKDLHSDVQSFKKPVNFISSIGFDVQRFYDLCNDKLKQEFISGQNYERPYFSVTELLQCLRLTYYQRMKYPLNVDQMFTYGSLLLIQEVGKEVHNIVQSLYDGFEEVEKVVENEIFKVKGRVDAITRNFVYELKTIDDIKFKNVYIDKHLIQGCIYAYLLNENGYKIDTVTIVYFLRSLKKVYSFDVPYDKKLAKKYLDYALILRNSLDNKKVPDRINCDVEQCKYCQYKQFCEKDGEIKIINPTKDDTVFLL